MRRELESEHGYYLIAVDDAPVDDEPAPADADDADGAAGAPIADDGAALDPSLLGYAGLLAPKGGGQGDVQTIAVAPAARGMGLGRGLMHALITESRRRGVAELFLEVRADNPIARSLYRSLGFEEIGVRPRYYRHGIDAVMMRLEVPPAVTRPGTPRGRPMNHAEPLVLGIETSCDETGVGIVRGTTTARQRDRLVDGGARPLRRRRARGGGARAPRGARPDDPGRARRGIRLAARPRRDLGDQRAGPRRCAHGRRRSREGARALARRAHLRGEPPRRARRRRPARHRSAARDAHRRPPRLRRAHLPAARARPRLRRGAARRDRRRRGGRGVRQGRPAPRPALPGRPRDRSRRHRRRPCARSASLVGSPSRKTRPRTATTSASRG